MPSQIKNIKASRLQNRVNIVFDSGLFIPFPFDQTVRLSLKKNQTLSDDEYRDLISKSGYYLSLGYSLRQVAMSPKTEVIIKPKIKNNLKRLIQKYKLDPSLINLDQIVADVITVLNEKKLLNDSDYFHYILQKNRHKSRRHLQHLLKNQGVNPDLIKNIDTNDQKKILQYLNKKNITREDLMDFKTKNKIIASLFRKGFSLSDVKTVIDVTLNKK